MQLGEFREDYVVVRNKKEYDEMWASSDPAWAGKASMSKRHVLITVKDLHWEWFNVLTFGLVSGLEEGIAKLRGIRDAALEWSCSTDDWPRGRDYLGMFLHVYAHSSVNSMHLHVLDMAEVGPTYHRLSYKNLSFHDAIEVLEDELEAVN